MEFPAARAYPLVMAMSLTALLSAAAVLARAATPAVLSAVPPSDATATATGATGGVPPPAADAAMGVAVVAAAAVLDGAVGRTLLATASSSPLAPPLRSLPVSLALWSTAPVRASSAVARWAGVDEVVAVTFGAGTAALSVVAGVAFVAAVTLATATSPTRGGRGRLRSKNPATAAGAASTTVDAAAVAGSVAAMTPHADATACWVLPADEVVAAPHVLAAAAVAAASLGGAGVGMSSASVGAVAVADGESGGATPSFLPTQPDIEAGGRGKTTQQEVGRCDDTNAEAGTDDVESVYYCTSGSEAEAGGGRGRRRMARDMERIHRMLLPAAGGRTRAGRRSMKSATAVGTGVEDDEEDDPAAVTAPELVDVAVDAPPEVPVGDAANAAATVTTVTADPVATCRWSRHVDDTASTPATTTGVPNDALVVVSIVSAAADGGLARMDPPPPPPPAPLSAAVAASVAAAGTGSNVESGVQVDGSGAGGDDGGGDDVRGDGDGGDRDSSRGNGGDGDGGGEGTGGGCGHLPSTPLCMPGSPCSDVTADVSVGVSASSSAALLEGATAHPTAGEDGGMHGAGAGGGCGGGGSPPVVAWMSLLKSPPTAPATVTAVEAADRAAAAAASAAAVAAPASDVESDGASVASVASASLGALLLAADHADRFGGGIGGSPEDTAAVTVANATATDAYVLSTAGAPAPENGATLDSAVAVSLLVAVAAAPTAAGGGTAAAGRGPSPPAPAPELVPAPALTPSATFVVDCAASAEEALGETGAPPPPPRAVARCCPLVRLPGSCRAVAVVRALTDRLPREGSFAFGSPAAVATAATVSADGSFAVAAVALFLGVLATLLRVLHFGRGGGGAGVPDTGGRNIRG